MKTEEKASYSTWKRHPMIWIGKVTDNEPFHGSQPCCGAGTCITHWIYESCHAGPPKTDRSYWRVLTKRGPQEEGLATHSNILAWRNQWTVWKGKKIWHQKMSPPLGRKVSSMLLGKSGGQLRIAPERMKWLGQRENYTHLWMKYLVVKVKSDDVKNNVA